MAELKEQLAEVDKQLTAAALIPAERAELLAQKAALEAELKAARRKRHPLMLGPNPSIGWGRT